jgi:hypothetical protein
MKVTALTGDVKIEFDMADGLSLLSQDNKGSRIASRTSESFLHSGGGTYMNLLSFKDAVPLDEERLPAVIHHFTNEGDRIISVEAGLLCDVRLGSHLSMGNCKFKAEMIKANQELKHESSYKQ